MQGLTHTTLPASKPRYLDVPGASLYYEVIGSGPLLLFISGGNGVCDVWRTLAQILQTNYTVAMYDRRGFSRSYLSSTEPQDYENRLATDVDDARRLIEHLTKKPAIVMGTSSGAIIALKYLTTFPDTLRTLIAHEPPALKILPDAVELEASQRAIYATYREAGVPPAMVKLGQQEKMENDMPGMLAAYDSRSGTFGNTQYWFEREFLQYPLEDLNVAAIVKQRELLILTNGRDSDHSAPHCRSVAVLSERSGLEIDIVSGAHVGYISNTSEFAVDLLAALQRKGASRK